VKTRYTVAIQECEKLTYEEFFARVDLDRPEYSPETEGYAVKSGKDWKFWLAIEFHEKFKADIGDLSDGYHTFNELYENRHVLFGLLCRTGKYPCFKSRKHHDGTMYDGWFIAGIRLGDTVVSYHIPEKYFDGFRAAELPVAPLWDGKTNPFYLGAMREFAFGTTLFKALTDAEPFWN
jgi:hypothetical protein